MKNIILIIFIVNILLIKTTTPPWNNPNELFSDNPYPFSIKKGYNEAVIFMENYINIYNLSNTFSSSGPVTKHYYPDNHDLLCISRKEKGGIYFKSYYYTSCLRDATNLNEFQIKVYDHDFNNENTYPSDSSFYTFTRGSIHFFKISSTEELVGVAWLNDDGLNIKLLDQTSIKNENIFPTTSFDDDIDCIFINKHQRIVCIFSYIDSNNEHLCNVNIFSGINFESNVKTFEGCINHLSRKIRGSTGGNEDSDIFYYYFVGTDGIAYVMPLKMESPSTINKAYSLYKYKIIEGCDYYYGSFDMAEDKFLGYNVFICVEENFKSKIKIQLFKIENDETIFYRGSINNPFIFTHDSSLTSSISMINFVVLKETLNFGFLSYRINEENKAKYTIINQPTCEDFPTATQKTNENLFTLFQFGTTPTNPVDFSDNIKNDNYNGGEVIIVNYNDGLLISVSDSDKKKVTINSIDYITGDLNFTFKVKNNYYESDLCKGKVHVNKCYKNCKKCRSNLDINFYNQQCDECKEGYFIMENFQNILYPDTISCCKKDEDCPNYLYLSNNKYVKCHESCLACKGGTLNDCISCYNQIEYNKYSFLDKIKINNLKISTSTEYYWEN